MDQHAASREVAEVKENGEILRRMLEILSEFCPRFCPTNLPEVPHLGRLLPNFCEKAGRLWHRRDANPTFLWCHHSASSTSRCSKHCLLGHWLTRKCLQTNVYSMFTDKCSPDVYRQMFSGRLSANSQSPPLSSLLLGGSYWTNLIKRSTVEKR